MNICRQKNENFQALFQNFEDVLLEQIIIDQYTVGILNDIDVYENIVTFVHILSSFNVRITLIAKINIVIFMV